MDQSNNSTTKSSSVSSMEMKTTELIIIVNKFIANIINTSNRFIRIEIFKQFLNQIWFDNKFTNVNSSSLEII
ncbi:hypothetical protein DERP_009066 [Dermatophagoides pteronyssinus]|uniref:Uncharacterized protein n=1 Tax=Dermatophagoides pteronyssinus TaxID=6956 RepID=A0ABQ8JH60_DERPT|nr:hypothetical protein DERP_009066 [Dermatophagoides pteronyssinus]